MPEKLKSVAEAPLRHLTPGDFYELSGLVGDYLNAFGTVIGGIKMNQRRGNELFDGVEIIQTYSEYFTNTCGEELRTDKNENNIRQIEALAIKVNEIIESKDKESIEDLKKLIGDMEDLLVTGKIE